MSKEDIIVNVSDKYGETCLDDKCNRVSSASERKPEGYVEIYEVVDGVKQLVGKHNLVVYAGREWIASRIFNVPNVALASTNNDFISWFGLGDAGAPPGDPLNPTSPTATDTGLSNEIPLHATDTDLSDFRGGEYYKHPFDGVTVAFEQDPANTNAWLIARVTVTIGNDDANGYNLSEAGLFISDSTVPGSATWPGSLFSRVTFPAIVKDVNRQLIFVWYVYT